MGRGLRAQNCRRPAQGIELTTLDSVENCATTRATEADAFPEVAALVLGKLRPPEMQAGDIQ